MPLILLLLCLAFNSLAQQIKILTEDLPPYQIVRQGKLVGGKAYEKVSKIMQLSGLSHNFQVLPWARAYQTARKEPYSLIFALARTKAREKHFQWLIPLTKPQPYFLPL